MNAPGLFDESKIVQISQQTVQQRQGYLVGLTPDKVDGDGLSDLRQLERFERLRLSTSLGRCHTGFRVGEIPIEAHHETQGDDGHGNTKSSQDNGYRFMAASNKGLQ